MKLKLEFTAEIIEDIGDVAPTKVYTAEQNKAMVADMLKDSCGENAEITIRECKLTKLA